MNAPLSPPRRAYWTQTSRRTLAALASVGLVALSLAFPSAASGAAVFSICHSTGSNGNPYVVNHPSQTADVGGHDGHNGPIWTPTIAPGVTWGDIIPPFAIIGGGFYAGKNWTVDGQEIYNNGCKPVNPDLRVVKTSSGNALAGTTGTYTINVSNIGTGTAHGPFTVSDTMPPGVVATAASGPVGSGWACTVPLGGGSVSCVHAADLAPGTAALAITVDVNWVVAGPKSNTATVTVLTSDPPANNTSTVTTTVGAIVLPNAINVTLDKTNDGSGDSAFSDTEVAPAGGGVITFRLVITNPTAFPLTVDSLQDVVDTNAAVGIICDAANATLVALGQTSLGATLPANSTRYCYFQTAGPADGDNSTDQATIRVHETADATNLDSAADDTSVSRATPPVLTGEVEKTSDANGNTIWTDDETTTAAAGSAITYHALITNFSTVPVSLALSDTYGPGPGGLGTTIVPTCVPAAPATLDAAGGANDSFTCNFTVAASSPAAGSSTVDTFTATLSARGSVDATPSGKATVRKAAAVIPAPLTQASAVAPTATQSQCSNGVATTPSYTVPATTGVVYTPATGGTATPGTTVTVTAAAAPGYTLSGPVSFPLVFAAAPDCAENVGVSKTGPGSAQPGDELVYSIDVTNVKGTPATGFTVTDVLPTGLSFSSATGTDFTCTNAGQTITCLYSGSLPAGQKATIAVRALLDSTFAGKTVANTAVVDPGRADTDAADNSSTATTTVVPLPLTGGGGGTAEAPSPSPSPAASGGGAALPFTGSDSARQLQAGVSLLVLGLFVALIARRRRALSE